MAHLMGSDDESLLATTPEGPPMERTTYIPLVLRLASAPPLRRCGVSCRGKLFFKHNMRRILEGEMKLRGCSHNIFQVVHAVGTVNTRRFVDSRVTPQQFAHPSPVLFANQQMREICWWRWCARGGGGASSWRRTQYWRSRGYLF